MEEILNSQEEQSCKNCMDRSCASSVLNEEQLELLSHNCYESNVKKGEVILRAGALTSHIIYLKSGYVKEFVTGSNNKSKIIQIIKHHSYLGLHSLFGDKVNHYSYTALADLKICYIDVNVFKQFIKEKGGFAQEILVYVCKESLNNYFHFINQSHKRINGRFADVLLYFSENIFYSPEFNILLSRQELADLMGISRENTIRVLTKFKEDGIININGRKIEILNMDMLKMISKNG
jgi:CRP-like cAMP-binding protein